jgi:hypothetical protein
MEINYAVNTVFDGTYQPLHIYIYNAYIMVMKNYM